MNNISGVFDKCGLAFKAFVFISLLYMRSLLIEDKIGQASFGAGHLR